MNFSFTFINNSLQVIDESGSIILDQPCYPDQTPWENEDSAIAWGNDFVRLITNQTDFFPKDGPGKEQNKKITKEEVLEMRKLRLGNRFVD